MAKIFFLMLAFNLLTTYSMKHKINTKLSDELEEKSIIVSPESMFQILKSEMENEFFVYFQPEKGEDMLNAKIDEKGKGKRPRLRSADYKIFKKKDQPATFSINDKIWIGPGSKNFEPKTMDAMENLFLKRFGYKSNLVHYYRIETTNHVSKHDYTWSFFITHGMFYIPRTEQWYALKFAAYYMKPTIDYVHKNSANPYCGIHWKRFECRKGLSKALWKGFPPERIYMGLNMCIALTTPDDQTEVEPKAKLHIKK